MRVAVVLACAASALIGAAPCVPAVRDPLVSFLPADPMSTVNAMVAIQTNLSFVDLARGAQDLAATGGAPSPLPLGQDYVLWRAMHVAALVDGRPVCVGAAVMALAAAWLAVTRRVRHAWLVGSAVAGASIWVHLRVGARLADFEARLRDVGVPGGEPVPLPWPWLMVGAAALLLAVATLRARRLPRPPPVEPSIFE